MIGQRKHRRGFTLLEYIAAAVVLGLAATATLHLVAASNATQRAIQEQRVAWQEASNCLEELTAEGFAALTDERLARCRLGETTLQLLTDGKLTASVAPVADEPVAKRVTVEVTWKPRLGERCPTVRLTTFVYRRS
jgi:prepilin-type N-terminal cleavage/methylation domain-containing protein